MPQSSDDITMQVIIKDTRDHDLEHKHVHELTKLYVGSFKFIAAQGKSRFR